MRQDQLVFIKNILFMLKMFSDNVLENFPQLTEVPKPEPASYPELAVEKPSEENKDSSMDGVSSPPILARL
jgi:hypothetical protein